MAEVREEHNEAKLPQNEPPATPQELRSETRRRLLKAGALSVPVMLTVYSRPLFAQTNGSVDALAYGGYVEDGGSIEGQNESTVDPFANPIDGGSSRTKTYASEKPASPFINNRSWLE
ncbi:hypothetical protein [Geoalkalibacter halelectricus]|uniref:Uncharacterized protein n=1 Tax=Geoalkalibacter halelectricus TaxID=2847045 RepID=A0ABY5ZIT0_9BACT|nr:hypothetical protein [Geoalkalibacter halelectricus]MDO3379682.1 hypothetical protein [Geoalkalibacter halelectricus]UWZ78503.1 hypothetical protein L9S41_12540 [Geoalkalibacter halelectricus]